MSSEKHTDNYRRIARERRRRRNRRIIIIRSIIVLALAVAAVLLALHCIKKVKELEIHDWYDAEAGYQRIFNRDKQMDALTPLATDVCVVRKEDNYEGEDFTGKAGLLAYTNGGYSIFTKDSTERLNPASTTKIMTALLAIKYGNLTDKVTITEGAMIDEPGASLAGLKVGETYALRQLLYGLMLPSGNDAAAAIAIHMSGSIEKFADLMNAEAQSLGCVDTHFVNPHGITDENHYTSAYDLYLILRECIQYDEFVEICQTKNYTAEYFDSEGLAASRTWKNSNKYVQGTRNLREGLTVVGGKTGTTLAAGNCLVLCVSTEDDKRYISIVLGATQRDYCYDNMDKLLQKID